MSSLNYPSVPWKINLLLETYVYNMKLLSLFSVFQVRVDSGIQPGSDISIYYDPMISKVSSIF